MVGDSVPFGDRLKRHRERLGMSRPVLGGLVGKSADWVKAIETGRLLTPRLPMLLRLAEVLQVEDLAELTGDERLTTASFGKAAHEQLPQVSAALARYPIADDADQPVDVPGLSGRVTQTWELWHGARRHRTAVASLLPGLITETRTAVRRVDGEDRRSVLRALAQTYHLAQLYLSFQPAPELVTLTGDRAMNAAQDADDPHSMAAAAWYVNHVYRDAGQQHDARVQLALDAAGLLTPERSDEDRALWGLLHLAVALSYAKVGQEGNAWRHWDEADGAVRALPHGYRHPWLIFARETVDAYAITILADLMRAGEATRRADNVDIAALPSATRRSFHTIEVARAYHQSDEHVATLYLLRQALEESPDTIRFNLFARSATIDLAERGGATVRRDAQQLMHELDLAS
jgi:transcriptional regulator with XRE-family HTH domain